MLRESLKEESGGHWGSGACTRLMSPFLELWLCCRHVAQFSSRLHITRPGSVVATWAYMDFTTSLWCPDHLHSHFERTQSILTNCSPITLWAQPIPADPANNLHLHGGPKWEQFLLLFACINLSLLPLEHTSGCCLNLNLQDCNHFSIQIHTALFFYYSLNLFLLTKSILGFHFNSNM